MRCDCQGWGYKMRLNFSSSLVTNLKIQESATSFILILADCEYQTSFL